MGIVFLLKKMAMNLEKYLWNFALYPREVNVNYIKGKIVLEVSRAKNECWWVKCLHQEKGDIETKEEIKYVVLDYTEFYTF